MIALVNWQAIRLTLAALILGYGGLLVLRSPEGLPAHARTRGFLPYLADKPLQEDSFYMLTVAWNAGGGDGLTYNHHQPTVGFQPLNVLVYAALGWTTRLAGGDRWTFARAVLCLGILNFLLFSAVTAAIGRRLAGGSHETVAENAPAIAAALTLANFSLFRQFTNGLETGLYTILVGCSVWLSLKQQSARPSLSGFALLGFVAGLAALARIDFLVVFLAYLLAGWCLRSLRLIDAFVAGVTSFMVVSPWLLRVYLLTGHWVPSSGRAQAGSEAGLGLLARIWLMGLAGVQSISPWVHVEAARIAVAAVLPPLGMLVAATALALVLAGVAALLVGPVVRRLEPANKRVLTSWVIAWAALCVVYPMFFFATYFYPRYATPLAAIGLPLLGVGIGRMGGRTARVAIAGMTIAFVATALLTLHNRSLGNVNVLTAGYVAEWLPPNERVGAFQSAVVGYFNGNVVNLDGKINQDALAALRQGRLSDYIDAQNIRYLADWPAVIGTLPSAYLERAWAPCPVPTPDVQIMCLARK